MRRSVWETDPSRASRRGILMAWTIWIMLAAGLIAAGLFNLLWTNGIRAEARRSAEASALAAGHAFLSDDLLRLQQESFETDGRIARCRAAAVDMSRQYCRQTAIPELSQHDLQVVMPPTATALLSGLPLVPDRITAAFDDDDSGFRLPLFFYGLTGAGAAKLSAGAAVSIEHAPVAFRPGSDVSVPMLPFAILDDEVVSSAEAQSPVPGHWTASVENAGGSDAWTWYPDSRQFAPGPDGLPELTVTINSDGTSGDDALIPIPFAAQGDASHNPVSDWIQQGLTLNGLQSLGLNQFEYPASYPVIALSPRDMSTVATQLELRTGDPLIFSLCKRSEDPSLTGVQLIRPVAARIVRVDTSLDGHIRVTLQPCVLVTATAVTASRSTAVTASPSTGDAATTDAAMANRYIYSVRLTE
jgi:hypothetical protein